jgi:hypothetical protein
MAEESRRFPAPWRADKVPGGYVVRDANAQALAYVYSRDNEADGRGAADRRQRRAVTGAAWKSGPGLNLSGCFLRALQPRREKPAVEPFAPSDSPMTSTAASGTTSRRQRPAARDRARSFPYSVKPFF